MSFCPYCGAELVPGARFCPGCGAAADVSVPPAVNNPGYQSAGPADYSIVLTSLGTCARSYADDVLEDLLGYSNAEAKQLVQMIPTQIAQMLTLEQAQYLAQALTEYGMQVAVLCGQNTVDLGQYATSSVFNSDGSFVNGALAALATITVANRLTRFERWARPSLLERLFAPRYRPPRPPRHVRRPMFRMDPGPRPPRAAPRPTPRPAPAPRPRGGGGPAGPAGGRGPGIGGGPRGGTGGRGPAGPAGGRGPGIGGGPRGGTGGRGPSSPGGGRGPGAGGGSRGGTGGRGPGGPGGRR